MKYINFSFLLILLSMFKLSAQIDNSSPFKNQIRISSGIHVKTANMMGEYDIDYYNDNIQIGLPTLSYIKYASKNDYHEISLNDLYIRVGNINTYNKTQIGIGLSYIYNISFIRKKISIVQPFIGFGTNMRYDGMKNMIFSTGEPSLRKNKIIMQLICAPRVNFNIKKHWCIDLSVPFDLAGISTNVIKHSTTTLPISKGKTVNNDYSFIPTNVNIRVGIGYKF